MRGSDLGELDVSDGRGDVKVDDGAVPLHGGPLAVGPDDIFEPAA